MKQEVRPAAEEAARKFAVEVVTMTVYTPAEIEMAVNELGSQPGSGLILLPDTFTSLHYKMIVESAARNRLPGAYLFRDSGELASYRPDVVDQFRRATVYIDRILSGEKAGDLPGSSRPSSNSSSISRLRTRLA